MNFSLLMVASLTWVTAVNACPTGYSSTSYGCRPNLPSNEYYANPGDAYPVCGPGRVPAKFGGSGLRTLDLASHTLPRSTHKAEINSGGNEGTWDFATKQGGNPRYMYRNYDICVCTAQNHPYTSPQAAEPDQIGPNVPGGSGKLFIPDDYSTLSTANSTYPGKPLVQIFHGSSLGASLTDPPSAREGSAWLAGNGVCGCPNFNERRVSIVPNSSFPSGGYCVPNHPSLTLQTFDPSVDQTNIMNINDEPRLNGELVRVIKVPSVLSEDNYSLVNYTRKIWKCPNVADQLNLTTGVCEYVYPYHKAGLGDGSTPPSAVSPRIGGATDAERWNNTINKKMAVCLNGFGRATDILTTVTGTPKLDCIDNAVDTYPDFNDLWASTDTVSEGSLPNAVVLANADGQPISGFYALDGKRCPNCSEFVGPLQPAMINALGSPNANGSPVNQGEPIKLPGQRTGSDATVYTDMKQKFLAQSKIVPTSTADRRKWPILVRTAAVYTCPDHKATGSGIAVHEVKDPITQKRVRARCTAAKDIKVHMRIEQLTEIKGSPKMPTIDSVISGANSSVSIQRIIAEKYGPNCPTGMERNTTTGECGFY